MPRQTTAGSVKSEWEGAAVPFCRELAQSKRNAEYSVALPSSASRVKRGWRKSSVTGPQRAPCAATVPPMNISKPKLIRSARANCPVCGKTAYSHGGIHPQCAVDRADKVDRIVLTAGNAVLATQPKPPTRKLWTRRCPLCNHDVHVRLAVCTCGHSFQPKVD
jgi:endogenous inhibitor of DNA gyrase (YacG/DUF329 family)